MTGQRTQRGLLLIAALLPALLPLYIILKYGVNFPYWDQLDPDIAGVYIKLHQHQLGLADLAAQHNEHRMLVPRLVYLLLNPITHWNTVVEMVAQWVVMVLTSVGLLCLARQTAGEPAEMGESRSYLFLWFLGNLLLFTPTQQENLMLGIGLANVMPFAWIVAALVVAGIDALRPGVRLGIAIALCALATYSSGNGMLAWPLVGLRVAWWSDPKELKAKRWMLLTWVLSAIAISMPYFVGYTQPGHLGKHPQTGNPDLILKYIPSFLGNVFYWATSFVDPQAAAMGFGITMLMLLAGVVEYFVVLVGRTFLSVGGVTDKNDPVREFGESSSRDAGVSPVLASFARARRPCHDCNLSDKDDRLTIDERMCRRMVPWLAIAGFAVCNSVLAAISRAGLGIDQALSSRYVVFSLQLPLALVFLLSIVLTDLRLRGGLRLRNLWGAFSVALLGMLMALQALSLPIVFRAARTARWERLQGKGAMLLIKVLPDNPALRRLIHPYPQQVHDEIIQLSLLGYVHPPLIESSNARLIQATGQDSPHPVSGRLERGWYSTADQVSVSGWAMSDRSHDPADAIFLTRPNEHGEPIIFATAIRLVLRSDLVAAHKDPLCEFAGWECSFPAALLPDESRPITINAWALDTESGRATRLDGQVTVAR